MLLLLGSLLVWCTFPKMLHLTSIDENSGIVLLLVARERIFLIRIRQAYLLSKPKADRLSSRVVLFLSVPEEALKEGSLHRVFGSGAKRSWLTSHMSHLEKLISDRDGRALELEEAEIKFLKNAYKRSMGKTGGIFSDDQADAINKARPRHRLIPFFGEEVDTVNWSRGTLPDLVAKVESERKSLDRKGQDGRYAMFVEYESQAAAHAALHEVRHHHPLRMQPRYIGVIPKEVLWYNLTMRPEDRISRGYLATAFIAASIILWSIPIGILATISKIDYWAEKVSWLHWVYDLPGPILAFLRGFVPPYLMSEFVSYVPKFYRREFRIILAFSVMVGG